jgi:hypothetical protein
MPPLPFELRVLEVLLDATVGELRWWFAVLLSGLVWSYLVGSAPPKLARVQPLADKSTANPFSQSVLFLYPLALPPSLPLNMKSTSIPSAST